MPLLFASPLVVGCCYGGLTSERSPGRITHKSLSYAGLSDESESRATADTRDTPACRLGRPVRGMSLS